MIQFLQFLNSGQQFAQHMQQANPDLIEQFRQAAQGGQGSSEDQNQGKSELLTLTS